MKWGRTNAAYLEEVSLTWVQLISMAGEAVRRRVREVGHDRWREEMQAKSSLTVYRSWKTEMREESCYDNTPASVTLCAARANCLRLNSRKRFAGGSEECILCGEDREDLAHFLLECPALQETRRMRVELQRLQLENSNNIIGEFLFGKKNLEEKKWLLHKMWKHRERLLKEQGE